MVGYKEIRSSPCNTVFDWKHCGYGSPTGITSSRIFLGKYSELIPYCFSLNRYPSCNLTLIDYFPGYPGHINTSFICTCFIRNCSSGWSSNAFNTDDSAQPHRAAPISITSQVTACTCKNNLIVYTEIACSTAFVFDNPCCPICYTSALQRSSN